MDMMAGKVKMTDVSEPTGAAHAADNRIRVQARDVTVHYGAKQALFGVSIDIPDRAVTSFNPFPKSIYENVAYGPRIHGIARNKSDIDEIVISSLRRAGLFNEGKDRLHEPGTGLSGGQQQRLCIARAIAVGPEVILMDEPCSALDPIATAIIEELIDELRENYTIVIVTHSMQQAARVSQKTAFFHLGNLIEEGKTEDIFTNPVHKQTQDYITGRIG